MESCRCFTLLLEASLPSNRDFSTNNEAAFSFSFNQNGKIIRKGKRRIRHRAPQQMVSKVRRKTKGYWDRCSHLRSTSYFCDISFQEQKSDFYSASWLYSTDAFSNKLVVLNISWSSVRVISTVNVHVLHASLLPTSDGNIQFGCEWSRKIIWEIRS